ncbi:hypothetical protein [Streptomyces sp. MNP-20]|uniref:hypothetical protein n=1 Tax=Streptomyces sp. MNP-20 TaxID=2721165 RepID=UPI00155650EF|nr:hypothetical protein [Streptomyces sp. MNP-20]
MEITLVRDNGRIWSTTHSGFTWHAFRLNEDGQAVALCRKTIRPRGHETGDAWYVNLETTHTYALTVRCERCMAKLDALEAQAQEEPEAPVETQGAAERELEAAPQTPAALMREKLVEHLRETGMVNGADDSDPECLAARKAFESATYVRSGAEQILKITAPRSILRVFSEYAESLLQADNVEPEELEAAEAWLTQVPLH